jgi:hypothetical protein
MVDNFCRIVVTGSADVHGNCFAALRLAVDTPPLKVTSITVNDGSPQRSMVKSLKLTFDSIVRFSGVPSAAFQLNRQSDNAAVTLSAAVSASGTSVTLTFTGGAIDQAGSLADGRYTLKIRASQIIGSGFDGNSNGVADGSPIDDIVLVGNPTNKLFRLFGDADGNGRIDLLDFAAFRIAYSSAYNSIFDFDGDGVVDSFDFYLFRQQYGMMI